MSQEESSDRSSHPNNGISPEDDANDTGSPSLPLPPATVEQAESLHQSSGNSADDDPNLGTANRRNAFSLPVPLQALQSNELQRRRTEALERILLASDPNLAVPQSASTTDSGSRGYRLGAIRRMQGHQQRYFLNRNNTLRRNDLERAIFIPFGTRTSMSAMNLPSSPSASPSSPTTSTAHQTQDAARELRNLLGSMGDNPNNEPPTNNEPSPHQHQNRINVSTFFMELTYSDHSHHNLFHQFRGGGSGSTETLRRRMEVHAANTMALIKRYCPVKLHKFSQFRYCSRAQRQEFFSFKSFQVGNGKGNPLALLDPTQIKCHTKVMVVIRDSNSGPVTGGNGKLGNPFTSYLMSYLSKKHLNPTCLTLPSSDSPLNLLIEQLYTELHVFSKKVSLHDTVFRKQAKGYLLLNTLAKLVENWNVPLLILDSSLWKFTEVERVLEFGKRFQLKVIDVDSSEGISVGASASASPSSSTSNKQRKVAAKRVGRQVKKAVRECNMARLRQELERREWAKSPSSCCSGSSSSSSSMITPNLISDDCRRIVYNLHERMTNSLMEQEDEQIARNVPEEGSMPAPQLTLLEDGILADIESSDAFKYSDSETPGRDKRCDEASRSRPGTGYSAESEDGGSGDVGFRGDQEKVSELLFNELNQRWRVHGPQRFIPKGGGYDAGPYCNPLLDSEKHLLVSVLQEVANFEMLKDIRNVLKDSKKDLEGRLNGYNPDFSNLIASAEEFLHGKSSCMEPTQEEIEFYKMPVSLVYSEAEVKYMKAKPPVYVVGNESPSQFIKMAIEDSMKLFWNSVIHTTCFLRPIPPTKRNKTRAVIVIEDNNEVLELLTAALWFFEKTPVATFQSKYCSNNADFLLSIDAIRFYYGNYPVYSTKKEDEHIFERWLGVGLNGLLRSFQSKVVLIDFPHPGLPLQKSRSILLNRLKLEEKLHNIRSFTVTKPSRKEDNLSTAEHILDEIQKCLEPRDRLIFRKARRMYLDLKLYKQLEQKSRQDLKALRDWGLPEPDNEHHLWERLRNSEIVINTPPPVPPSSIPTTPTNILNSIESNETLASPSGQKAYRSETVDDDDNSTLPSIASDEDFSDSTSTVISNLNKNIMESGCSSHSDENEHDEDEVIPLVVANPPVVPQEPEDDNTQHITAMLEYHSMHSNRASRNGREPRILNEIHEDDRMDLSCIPIPIEPAGIPDESDGMDYDDEVDLSSIYPTRKPSLQSSQANSENGNDSTVVALKRSTGFFNLLDETIAVADDADIENPTEDCDCDLGELGGDEGDDSSSNGMTRIEFTLAPKMTSGESSTESNASLFKSTGVGLAEPLGENEKSVDKSRNMSEESVPSPKKKRSFQETCIAHLGKLSKSFTQLLRRRRKPRRIFPEGLLSPSLTNRNCIDNPDETDRSSSSSSSPPVETASRSQHHSKSLRDEVSSEQMILSNEANSNSSIGTNHSNGKGNNDTSNDDKDQVNWLNNVVRFMRGKVHKKRNT